VLAYYRRGERYEGYAQEVQQHEPVQWTVEAPNVLECLVVAVPEDGYEGEAGQEVEDLGLGVEDAPKPGASPHVFYERVRRTPSESRT